MATYLASIFGTEADKVNCSFYLKIGACRHGDRCSRKHVKPTYSQTVLMTNFFHDINKNSKLSPEQEQRIFDDMYEEVYVNCSEYGVIEEMVVCGNSNDHMVGNVYVRYKYEEDAGNAVAALNNEWYDKVPIRAELSPVTDFREACCRLNSGDGCARGGFCNFIHRKLPSAELAESLRLSALKTKQLAGRDPRSESPSDDERGNDQT